MFSSFPEETSNNFQGDMDFASLVLGKQISLKMFFLFLFSPSEWSFSKSWTVALLMFFPMDSREDFLLSGRKTTMGNREWSIVNRQCYRESSIVNRECYRQSSIVN